MRTLGSLLNSVFILAFDSYLHFSHLYLSVDSKVSSFKNPKILLSKLDSNARLSVIKGLKVIDYFWHFPQVTMVFCIPKTGK